jgi:subtilisin family serine protease
MDVPSVVDPHQDVVLPFAAAATLFLAIAAEAGPADRAVEPSPWWVHFTDKGLSAAEELPAIERARADLTERARNRRAKSRSGALTDLLDVPLHEPYVEAVQATGAGLRVRFKWLNAVSVDATAEELGAIEQLPFVMAVRPVARAWREPVRIERIRVDGADGGAPRGALDYGECASHILPVQIDQLHDAGYSGAGILIGVLDTGFELVHDALGAIDVQQSWDFVNGDGTVENEAGDHPNQHNHGTFVLSIVGGWDPGNLIGPAYGATYLLAKTESLDFEQPVEEDYWAAAAVWAESLGVDVITTSLGYKDWYTWDDLDGNTATITIAADLAVANGITVVTSAGNQGTQDWTYIMVPADGDSVIAVGAVDSLDVFQEFSSRGPTADGRIKPDVCAMGQGTLGAVPNTTSDYGRGSGTSLSAPLVAGAAALLLEAHPLWGPIEVREALRTTATQAAAPDTAVGWGVIRAGDANSWTTGVTVGSVVDAGQLTVSPNPSATVSVIQWTRFESRDAELAVYDVRGRLVRRLGSALTSTRGSVAWNGRDEAGRLVPTGIYFARMSAGGGASTARVIRIR